MFYSLRLKRLYRRRFLGDLEQFKMMGGLVTEIKPALDERHSTAGTAQGHYFHQDLLVSQFIHEDNPNMHVDVGSRIDGFVAHVASFRKINVLDIRPLDVTNYPNIQFQQIDIMGIVPESMTDSISSLHAIEHFGLGRYGDKIDPSGHLKAFSNLIRMLNKGGKLYLSFPIAQESKVIFNMHRIFHPSEVLGWSNQVRLIRFDYVDDFGSLFLNGNVSTLPKMNYGCGIYTFIKK